MNNPHPNVLTTGKSLPLGTGWQAGLFLQSHGERNTRCNSPTVHMVHFMHTVANHSPFEHRSEDRAASSGPLLLPLWRLSNSVWNKLAFQGLHLDPAWLLIVTRSLTRPQVTVVSFPLMSSLTQESPGRNFTLPLGGDLSSLPVLLRLQTTKS